MGDLPGDRPPAKPMPIGQLIDELSKHPRDAVITNLWLEADYPDPGTPGHLQISLNSVVEWENAKTCLDTCRCRQHDR